MAKVLLNYAWETTNTSGTGTYTLAGAKTNYETFESRANAESAGASDELYYFCTNNAGTWESGDGVLGGGGTTLTRANIYASSTGSAINWPDTSAKEIYAWPPGSAIAGQLLQVQRHSLTTDVSGTATIPEDNSIPTNSEGTDSSLSVTITPADASNFLHWELMLDYSASTAAEAVVAVFRTTTCIHVSKFEARQAMDSIFMKGYTTAAGTNPQTWTVRYGLSTSGTMYLGTDQGTARFGTANPRMLIISEYQA